MAVAPQSHSVFTRYPTALDTPIALYIHIPFCLSKCNYCDFNTYEGIENLMEPFVGALTTEIELWSNRLDNPEVSTVFFGGGTPSYLPAESITHLMRTIDASTRVATDAEITLEANPDDVGPIKCDTWLGAGFNRISIGVQSFHDSMLSALSRRHSADDAAAAVSTARDAGFDNINIDLMFGLPNQPLSIWETTLNRAVELETEHLSLYGLQIEPGTPLHRNVNAGLIPIPSDDLAADMYEMAIDTLDDAGYEHYEISNWAKPRYRSQHNLAYWLNKPYLGVGPGAHSSIEGRRFANAKSPRGYIKAINEGEFPTDFSETTSLPMAMSETMMLGMRLAEGVSDTEFRGRFGRSLESIFGAEIQSLENAGLIQQSGDRIKLTRRGKLLGNTVFEQFILTDH